jgi:hypothetical protein
MLNLNYNIIGSQRDRTVRKAPPLPFGDFYIQLQVVGGGGAGSADIGGAGGAGGVHYVSNYLIDDKNTYTVVIGEGHDGVFQDPWTTDPPVQSNASGSNSYFRNNTTLFDIIGYGGGNSGVGGINASGNKGGSGGGGSQFNSGGGPAVGLSNTGSAGGASGNDVYRGGGGGGGATEAGHGGNGSIVSDPSLGGEGISIIGFDSGSVFIAGGGSGGREGGIVSGGLGGGGASGLYTGNPETNIPVQRGQPNTGGGGGGISGIPTAEYTSSFNTGGGSGLVVIYYKGIQQAIGGEVETRELNDGFYTQHIFTASGQFIPIAH